MVEEGGLRVDRLPKDERTRELLIPFWKSLKKSSRAVLFLDYDGTLAPFQTDPYKAYPYPQVPTRLNGIAKLPCRLVLVTGRALDSIVPLLKEVNPLPEIWANHGMEVLKASGRIKRFPVDAQAKEVLQTAKAWLDDQNWGVIYEAKPTSIAVHWRGRTKEEQETFCRVTTERFKELSQSGLVEVLPFDGGMELRVKGRTKGDVVRDVLAEEGEVPAAYLGDDITDEDAFVAINGKGIGLLVRKDWRETKALGWLVPPEELIWFLDKWIMHLE